MRKHALVTGTSSGIGLALVLRLVEMGYHVHGLGRRPPEALTGRAGYSHQSCDLSDLDALPGNMARFIADRPEVDRFEAVFLNAGQFCEAMRRVSETPMDELMSLLRLNCLASKGVLDALIGAGVETPLCAVSASIAGSRARAGNGGYAVSKAALNMLVELYALEHPEIFFAVIGLCVVKTFLSGKIGTLPLPDDPVFAEQAKLRARAFGAGYAVSPDARAEHLISLLLPAPDPRIVSGKFVDIRNLVDCKPLQAPFEVTT